MKDLTQNNKNVSHHETDINALNRSFIHDPDAVQATYNLTADLPDDFISTKSEVVLKYLSQLRAKSSAGPDGLQPIVAKECRWYIAPTLTEILNLSFSSGLLPTSWKTVKITPIPKGDTGSSSMKFRPIASSSILLKVAEKVILDTILPQLNRSSDKLQFAYKKKRSTVDAVATLYHSIAFSIDKGDTRYQCAFLDFSSAFNTIDRRKILLKLRDLGIPTWSLLWLCDYFRNRFQYSSFNGKKSETALNCWGVLQGAVLSPFLFSLYTDSIRLPHESFLIKYADDFALGYPLKKQQRNVMLQNSLNIVAEWSKSNDLRLNLDKCNCCTFSLDHKTPHPDVIVRINDVSLQPCITVKYLGVTFSSDLTWTNHIEVLYKKCLRLSFHIRRLRSIAVPNHIIKKFVDACILPIILYGSPIIFPGLLKKDLVILRRSIKTVSKSSGIDHKCVISVIVGRHFSALQNLCNNILGDSDHPLFPALSSAQAHSSTRSSFKRIFARTSMFRRSPLPSLARFLSNKEAEVEALVSALI